MGTQDQRHQLRPTVNREGGKEASTRRTLIRRVLLVGLTLLLGFGLIGLAWGWLAWRTIDRFAFDPAAGRPTLGLDSLPPETEEVDTFLLIGSDAHGNVEGARADAVLLFVLPRAAGVPALLSLPRALAVKDPCTGSIRPLNHSLGGCGDEVNGPELLALSVEELTGVPIDHAVAFEFEGFTEIIDALGGVEICVEYPVGLHPTRAVISGCQVVDGRLALKWMRNRNTFELVGDEWRVMPGVGDRQRSERQQELVVRVLESVQADSSPLSLLRLVGLASSAVAIDDRFGLVEAFRLWRRLRAVNLEEIQQLVLTGEPGVTVDGDYVLEIREPVSEQLAPIG